MTANIPARPVLSDACKRSIAALVADWPPLTPDQRARIGALIRSGRRLARTVEQQGSAA